MIKKFLLVVAVAALPMAGFAASYATQCPNSLDVESSPINTVIEGTWTNYSAASNSGDADGKGFQLRWANMYNASPVGGSYTPSIFSVPICYYDDGKGSARLLTPLSTMPNIIGPVGSGWQGGPREYKCVQWANANGYVPITDPSVCSWK